MTQTTAVTELTPEQEQAAGRIDALDLDPIAFRLINPEPGVIAMSLAEADERIADYRRFLKLLAWYPGESIPPTKAQDEVWHLHLLDTAKWAQDSVAVFGRLVHHFPYFGLRGPADEAALRAAGQRARDLFRQHFGTSPAGTAGVCTTKCDQDGQYCDTVHGGGGASMDAGMCVIDDGQGKCHSDDSSCRASASMNRARPRPDRTGLAAPAS